MLSNLFKVAILAAPLVGLIFYYVVLKQNQMDVEMKKENIKFEQEWNRFNENFIFTSPEQRDYYKERNEEIAKELEELKKKEQEKEQKVEKFEQEFEKGLEEANKKQE